MPKQRFPVMLDQDDLRKLKSIQTQTGAAVAEQIRRAVKAWIEATEKLGRPRAQTRRKAPATAGTRG